MRILPTPKAFPEGSISNNESNEGKNVIAVINDLEYAKDSPNESFFRNFYMRKKDLFYILSPNSLAIAGLFSTVPLTRKSIEVEFSLMNIS